MKDMKEAQVRRNEILDSAEELFRKYGFDGTSTNDILEKVGIARGTLYYHFKSKEHIMDALIERYNERMVAVAKVIAENKTLPVCERIISVVMSMNVSKGEKDGVELMAHIHKPQNALMHQKIQKVMIQGVTPILTEIVKEGIGEGLFETPFPYETMEMVMIYASTVFDDDLIEMTEEERMMRMQAFVLNIERLFGAQPGSLAKVIEIFKNGEAC